MHARLNIKTRIVVVALAAAALSLLPSSASAAAPTGGSRYWSASTTGGVEPGTDVPVAKKPAKNKPARKRKRRSAPPVIARFVLDSNALFDEGRPLRLRYRVNSRTPRVRVRLVLRTAGGRYLRTINLGVQRTRRAHSADLSQQQLGITGVGDYKLRMIAVDRNGRRAVRAARVPTWLGFNFSDHRFPLTGQFSWGGEGSRFGAGRPGHIHQGQDLAAAEGTPVVAPHGGRVSWVKYQADGAGWYVVLDALDGRDYVFMHLKAGSIEVEAGDSVPTGKLLARVGNTGSSSGAHLHFEVWQDGDWQFGGKPVDPRPLLEAWYASAPGGARAAIAAAGAAPLD